MLESKFIRENPDLIREAARKKHLSFDVDNLLAVDGERRKKIVEVEALRAELNVTSTEIAKISDETAKQKAIAQMRDFKGNLAAREAELATLEEAFQDLMHTVPNIPDPSVPEGESDADNQEIRRWGSAPDFSFTPKDHKALLELLDLADFERGAKVSGFRGYFLKNEGALLAFGILQMALAHCVKKKSTPLIAPALAREGAFRGTGYFPGGKDDLYKTQDDLYLVGTSEVSVMGMLQGEVLDENSLPLRFASFSPCFRREAGAHGKDVKGLYRVHEFLKVEQVILSRADHMESVRLHEEITKNAEEFLQELGLHYRVVINCGGDLGLGQVKKYDIETWIPSQQKFGETHSASYFHDFQTRRLNIKYRDKEGVMRFAHSLNSTAIAAPRILISILEQYQREDGSVSVPEALKPFVGTDSIRPK